MAITYNLFWNSLLLWNTIISPEEYSSPRAHMCIFAIMLTKLSSPRKKTKLTFPPKKDQANLPPSKKTKLTFPQEKRQVTLDPQERWCNTHSFYWPYDMHSVQWTCTSSPPPPLLGVSSEPSSESSQRPPAEKIKIVVIANFNTVTRAKFWPHWITGKSSSQARHKRSNKMQCWTLCNTFKPWLLRFVRYIY